MNRIIECVPNFSEGNDLGIIKQITDEVESVEGVRLLNIDPGKATNRTVVTFVGGPDAVIEAAFLAINKAAELIDMSQHKGEHPRMGATDVCPLIPVSGITMEETAEYAKKLGDRVGAELKIPVYLYEYAQPNSSRKNLSIIRAGEYEGFFKKIKLTEWKPDYGPSEFSVKAGATVIGARDFLVAYNVNLNTTSVRRANSVAFDVRENGRKIIPILPSGEKGKEIIQPGACKAVKAIGWYIEEYGIAQVSMNLTNLNITPVHIAFDECVKSAHARGLRVTGSELVGLIPLKALLDAGKYFLRKQQRSLGVSEKELIRIAIKSLGLDELNPFKPEERIIEYMLDSSRFTVHGSQFKSQTSNLSEGVRSPSDKPQTLTAMTLNDFADETASESPAPGGGSVAAYVGALGASLAAMVANLSANKKGWEERWEEFSNWAERGQQIKAELLKLVDEDTSAFNKVMVAFSLPKSNEEEKKARTEAIQAATKSAMEIPFKVMELSYAAFEIIKAMAEHGNPNSASDAGVAALCARSSVMGAFLNVKINAASLHDKSFAETILKKGKEMQDKTIAAETEILKMVNEKIG